MAENTDLWQIERDLTEQGIGIICGCDEAGAGPLAGPVYAAAVILPPYYRIEGLNDSKKLTEKKREALYEVITQKAVCWAVARVEAAEIDGANRLQKIFYINLPVLVPTMLVLFILQCGSLLNVGYEKVYALQNATNLTGSEVISTYVYKIGVLQFSYSYSTAVGLFNSVVNLVMLLIVNTICKRLSDVSLW